MIYTVVKVIKLYAWEKSFLSVITNIRHQELHYLRKAAYLTVISMVTSMSSPFLVLMLLVVLWLLFISFA